MGEQPAAAIDAAVQLEILPQAWQEDPLFAARLQGVDVAAYGRTRNHLDGAVTGLSPWITHGSKPNADVPSRSTRRSWLASPVATRVPCPATAKRVVACASTDAGATIIAVASAAKTSCRVRRW